MPLLKRTMAVWTPQKKKCLECMDGGCENAGEGRGAVNVIRSLLGNPVWLSDPSSNTLRGLIVYQGGTSGGARGPR